MHRTQSLSTRPAHRKELCNHARGLLVTAAIICIAVVLTPASSVSAATNSCWQRLDLGNTRPIIAGANGLYVSAELGNTGSTYGMLRARSAAVGPWERFSFSYVDSSRWGNVYAIRASNGLYVSAELGNTGSTYGMLRARSAAVGPWEQFVFYDNPNGDCSFTSFAAMQVQPPRTPYVSAELGNTGSTYGMLRARSAAVGPWERFFFTYVA